MISLRATTPSAVAGPLLGAFLAACSTTVTLPDLSVGNPDASAPKHDGAAVTAHDASRPHEADASSPVSTAWSSVDYAAAGGGESTFVRVFSLTGSATSAVAVGVGADPTSALTLSWNGATASLTQSSPFPSALGPGFASSPSDVWVATNEATTLHHFDGTTWTQDPTSFSVTNSYVMAGTGPSDVWLGTQWNFGVEPLFHYDGTGWTNANITNDDATQYAIAALWPSGPGEAWFACNGLQSYTASGGGTATLVSPAPAGATAIWGSSASDVWMLESDPQNDTSDILGHWNGSALATTSTPAAAQGNLTALAGSGPDDVWLLGPASLYHYDGTAWSDATTKYGAPHGGLAIFAVSATDVYVMTVNRLYHLLPGTSPSAPDAGQEADGGGDDGGGDDGGSGDNTCAIGGVTYASGAADPANSCLSCQPAQDADDWSYVNSGTLCTGGACCTGTCTDIQTDHDHCGSCSIQCGPAHACVAGACACASGGSTCTLVQLAGATSPGWPENATGLILAGSVLYWDATPGDTTVGQWVREVSISGGAVTNALTPAATGDANVGTVAVVGTTLYWPDESQTLWKRPLAGGASVAFVAGQAEPVAVVALGANLYWANAGTEANNFTDGTVVTAPLAGGAPVTLATSQSALSTVVPTSTTLYWVTETGLMSVPIAGGTPTTLAAATEGSGPAVDGTNVYWGDGMEVLGMPLGGGARTTLATLGEPVAALASDGQNVYVGGATLILRVPVTGGAATTLATEQPSPTGIVVDDTSVYWSNAGSTTASNIIMKYTPK